jgi:hypothetical protein
MVLIDPCVSWLSRPFYRFLGSEGMNRSGGFHNPSLCPMFLDPVLKRFEKWLQPIEKYMAFRMLVALEKG